MQFNFMPSPEELNFSYDWCSIYQLLTRKSLSMCTLTDFVRPPSNESTTAVIKIQQMINLKDT